MTPRAAPSSSSLAPACTQSMKIAFVSQWFDPEGGSAAIPGAVARALQATRATT